MDGRSLRVLLKTLRDNGVTRYKCDDVEIELGAAADGPRSAGASQESASKPPPQDSVKWPPRPVTKLKDIESLRMVTPPSAMEVDGDG